MKVKKNKNKCYTNYNVLTFRVAEPILEKTIILFDKVKKRVDVSITRANFLRTVFEKGLDKLEKEIAKSDKYFCEKCGKRYAVTVPRHLRKRLDVCECPPKD